METSPHDAVARTRETGRKTQYVVVDTNMTQNVVKMFLHSVVYMV
jgi:hypothetical protein